MHRPLALLACASLLITLAGACGSSLGSPPADKCNSTQWADPVGFTYVDDANQPLDPATYPIRLCQPRAPDIATDGHAACVVLTAKSAAPCTCDSNRAEVDVAHAHAGVVDLARESAEGMAQGWNCFCELPQLTADQALACTNDTSEPLLLNGQPVSGFCYVDATTAPPIGNPELVKDCAATEKHAIRIVGNAKPPVGGFVFILCEADLCDSTAPAN